ncbi:transmembrane protein [Arabidopsis thaliana]|nr:uncharacterized protein AT3G44753 [Arabidopsis thaliana]ANM65743.1 transmembrane protein [Arabidopsis thaliana]|eukprot:NP_001327690.1 transmembrane protein [Arabidopsis thaliana]
MINHYLHSVISVIESFKISKSLLSSFSRSLFDLDLVRIRRQRLDSSLIDHKEFLDNTFTTVYILFM